MLKTPLYCIVAFNFTRSQTSLYTKYATFLEKNIMKKDQNERLRNYLERTNAITKYNVYISITVNIHKMVKNFNIN